MSETEYKITDIKTLRKSLIHLCSSSNFHNEISDLKDALDLPTKFDHADMKALLIRAVVDCFGEKSFETDAVLMEFGLSSEKGLGDNLFEHDSDTEESRLCARRKEFLKISNYIYRTRNSRKKYKFNTYEEMVKLGKDAIDTTIETLGNRNGGYIEAVAKKIYTKRNDKNFIESRKEYLEGSGKARKVKPPPMTNFRDNSSSQSQGEEPNGSVKPDGSGRRKTEPGHTNTWWGNFFNNKILKIIQRISIKIILFNITETNQHVTIGNGVPIRKIDCKKIILAVMIVITITALAYGGYKAVYKSSHSRQPIKEILISSTEIILEPDEIFDLDEYISVLPKSITNPILSFTSSDPDLVTVSKDGLLNAKNVQQDDELHAAEITVQAENGTTAKKIVHVQDSDKETSIDTDYEIENKVRLAGDTKWTADEITAKVGDKVEFQMQYKNTDPNGLTHNNVMVRNILPASLKYVPGSTILFDSLSPSGAPVLEDTLVTEKGINIGNYKAGANAYVRFTAEVVEDGLACGSNVLVDWAATTVKGFIIQDSARVRVRNDVNVDTEIFYTIENDVRIVNSIDKTWKKEVDAKVGDKVEFQIEYKNTRSESQKNVMLRDILPANLKYVPGSTRLANGNHPSGITIDQDDLVTAKGINIGSYAPGANALVRFYAEVVDENLADGEFVLHNWAHGTVNAKVLQDSARVRVEK